MQRRNPAPALAVAVGRAATITSLAAWAGTSSADAQGYRHDDFREDGD